MSRKSMLGSGVFNIFLKVLEDGMSNELAKYVHSIKLLRLLTSTEYPEELQNDLTKVGNEATQWPMKVNVDECKVTATGENSMN